MVKILSIVWASIALALCPVMASGQDAGEAPAPAGSADDQGAAAQTEASEGASEIADRAAEQPSAVPIAELQLRVGPLRKAQLEEEVERWLGLLQARSVELAEKEIAARGAEGDAKEALLAEAAEVRDRRTALVDRVRVVIDELERKGGDVEEYRRYTELQSGLTVDTSDWQATLLTVLNWVQSPEGGIRVGLRILAFLAVMLVTWIVAGILAKITRAALSRMKKSSQLLRDFLANLVHKVTMIIGAIIAVSVLGVNITPLMAAVGGAVIVVGLALQGTLSNFASGIMILLFRPFDVGSAVEAGGVTGKVESLSLFSTTMLTFDNQVKIVPNSAIWGGTITNITGRSTRRVDMTFGIGYGDDMAKAERILEEVVKAHPKVLAEPPVTIKVSELGDSSVNFIVRPWSKTEDYWDVYWDLTRQVKERFDAEGVSIPFPQRDVHVYTNGAVEVKPEQEAWRQTTAVADAPPSDD